MSQITQSQVKFYKSSDTDSVGGDISATEITDNVLNNLFDDVLGDETITGAVEYRKIFIKNTNPDTQLQSVKVWIEQLTDSEDDEIHIATCNNLTGSNPTGDGQVYVQPDSAIHADALDLGNLDAGDYAAVWIKRVVDSGAAAYNNNSSKLEVSGAYSLT